MRGSVRGASVFLISVLVTGPALAQDEPGAAALKEAREAIARLSAAAASPTATTGAIGSTLTDLAKLDAPAAPVRGQSIDSAAQPFLAALEPRIENLRETILDRRHRFLAGADRPPAAQAPLETATFDIRSITDSWTGFEDQRAAGPTPTMRTSLVSATIGVDADKLRALVVELLASRDGSGETADVSADILIVRAPPEKLARVDALVERLRGETGRRFSIDLTAYDMPSGLRLEQASQATPEDGARVLAQALESGKATILARRSQVIVDGAVAHFAGTDQRAYLSGAIVNQTGVVPVVEPFVSDLDLGLEGDVRATATPGRNEVAVDLDLAVRELEDMAHTTVQGHELELPRTVVTRCSTTLLVPLGATVLAGGSFSGSASVTSTCVFSVKVSPFQERAPFHHTWKVEEKAPLAASSRPEVGELDALLALVDGALSKVRAARHLETRLFDVRDILEVGHSRIAPRLGLEQAAPEARKKQTFTFDDSSGEEAPSLLDSDKLQEVVKGSTGGDEAWREDMGVEYDLHRGEIIVTQTPGELARIEYLLGDLRKGRTGDLELAVDWYRLDDALLAELAPDGTVLTREALAKLDAEAATGERASRSASAFVIARRGEIGVLQGGPETTFVSDFEAASGGTGEVVAKVNRPLVSRVREGLALVAFGHGDLSGPEGTLTLGARLGLARVVKMAEAGGPDGLMMTPSLDMAETSFEGVAPGGAIVLAVDHRDGEKRPAFVAVLRGRLAK